MVISKMNVLKKIVNHEFNVNLNHKKDRTRFITQGRRVFSKILYDMGVSKSKIGRAIGKDHATVIHYLGKIDVEIETYPDFKEKYESCLNKFHDFLSVNDVEDDITGLVNEVHSLRDERAELKKEISNLKASNRLFRKKLKEIRESIKDERLGGIQEMIRERIPAGKEDEYHKKILRVFNGAGLKEYGGYEHIHSF